MDYLFLKEFLAFSRLPYFLDMLPDGESLLLDQYVFDPHIESPVLNAMLNHQDLNGLFYLNFQFFSPEFFDLFKFIQVF